MYSHIHCWCGDVCKSQSQEGTGPLPKPPPPGTDHYEVVEEGKKSTPLGAGVYEEIDKQDTEGHNKHYQELDLMKMEGSEYASMKA